MVGTNAPNRRRINSQTMNRIKRRKPFKRTARLDTEVMNPQHRRALLSNPHANVELSGKKKRQLRKMLKRVQMDAGEVDMQDAASDASEMDAQEMEVTGPGTTLGAPAQQA